MNILYLCDGKKEQCSGKIGCFFGNSDLNSCKHTTDPAHALNGPCPEPQSHPERFEPVTDKADGAVMYYFEKDVSV